MEKFMTVRAAREEFQAGGVAAECTAANDLAWVIRQNGLEDDDVVIVHEDGNDTTFSFKGREGINV